MKKLDDVVYSVQYGSVLTINKNKIVRDELYGSCLIVFDGTISMDVKKVELGNFLSMIPNIQKQLDKGFTYIVKYLYEEEKYHSSIIIHTEEDSYKNQKNIVNNFQVLSDDFFNSILELDTKIAQSNIDTKLVKEKVIS